MTEAGVKCPACGQYTFAEENNFDICPFCGWENDGVQYDDHDYAGGANPESLNEYRKLWSEGRTWMQIKKQRKKMIDKKCFPRIM